MDPLSITSGALQVVTTCAQCTVALARYIDSVKTVDERIRELVAEINTLSATNAALKRVLEDKTMLAAAKAAEESAGGQLWVQIRASLQDCQSTMNSLAKVLQAIDSGKTGLFSRPIKQFKETIKSGDIAKYRQRIQIFNSTISMPVQMMTVYLQIEQRELDVEQQRKLDQRMKRLSETIEKLNLQMAQQGPTASVTSLQSISEDETVVDERIRDCTKTAQRFLSSASEAASSHKSWTAGSTVVGHHDRRTSIATGSEFGEVLSQEKYSRIDSWVRPNDTASSSVNGSVSRASQALSDITADTARTSALLENLQIPERKTDSMDLKLRLTFNHLENGQKHAERGDHAAAEKSFTKALAQIEKNDFRDRIALQASEVRLLIADACLRQKKYEYSESLLLPLSKKEGGTDDLTALASLHLLAELYLEKQDLDRAEPCAMEAVEGRADLMGSTDLAFVSSLKLLLEVYKAKGDDAEYEAWEKMLPVQSPVEQPSQPIFNLDDLDPLPEESEIPPRSEKSPPINIDKPGKRRMGMPWRKPSKDQKRPSMEDLLRTPDVLSRSPASSARSVKMPSPMLSPVRPSESVSELGDYEPNLFSIDSPTAISRTNTALSTITPTTTRQSVSKSPPQPLNHYPSSQKTSRELAISSAFNTIKAQCVSGNHKKATREALAFLKAAYAYTDKAQLLFQKELLANVQNSGQLGLAGTGRGYAPIHFFASSRREELLEINLLINHGVDVNANDSIGKNDVRPGADTALHLAVEQGHVNIVRRLLDCPGIKLELKGSMGLTPLWLAMGKGHTVLVEALLEKGAKIEQRDSAGQITTTLLHRAAQIHDTSTVRLLLERSHPVDLLDSERRTPLMMAFRDASIAGKSKPWPQQGTECVNLLLDNGADLELKDSHGNNAMSRALKGPPEAVELLSTRKTSTLLVGAPNVPSELGAQDTLSVRNMPSELDLHNWPSSPDIRSELDSHDARNMLSELGTQDTRNMPIELGVRDVLSSPQELEGRSEMFEMETPMLT